MYPAARAEAGPAFWTCAPGRRRRPKDKAPGARHNPAPRPSLQAQGPRPRGPRPRAQGPGPIAQGPRPRAQGSGLPY